MKFSIRDLLWLTLVVAVSVAWLLERAQTTNRADKISKEYGKFYTLVLRKCDPQTIPPIEDFPIGNKIFRETIFLPPDP